MQTRGYAPFTDWIMRLLRLRNWKRWGDHNDSDSKGRLDAQGWLLLTVYGLYASATALSGTFINVYLWKVSGNLALNGWFALANQGMMAIVFWLAGKWVKEFNKIHCLQAGIILSGLFYLLVLWLQQRSIDYVVPLGMLLGTASGLYWLAFNVVYFEITEPHNRDRFNGLSGFLSSGAGMVAPWISGILITSLSGTTGYRVIFTVSMAVFLIGAAISLKLHRRPPDQRYEWFYGFNRLRIPKDPWRRVFPALMAQGFREGVFGFIMSLLIYISTADEMKLGNYALLTSAIGLLTYMLAGRLIRPTTRRKWSLIGSIGLCLVLLPLLWKVNFTTLMFFGVATALFFPLYMIPMLSSVFDMIGSDKTSVEHRVEFVVLRELGLNSGRMLGTVLYLITVSLTTEMFPITLVVIIIGSAPILNWWFMRKQFINGHKDKVV